ncbi:MAG: hypothetical protein LBG16_00190 [Elusimicrobiota bacterium]|nr:hypothetical protein [Elusimicrobiota bacterium]
MLVAVLIIGILAAIALSQYQKSVWKTRAAQLQQSLKNLANAEEAYYLYNGDYIYDFDKLDFDFTKALPLTSVAQTYGFEHQRVRANDKMVLMINSTADHGGRLMSYLRDGKYGGGFQYWLQK